MHGPSVQGRGPVEENQARRHADSGYSGLLLRPEHGTHVAQLHGGPVSLFLRRVGTATDGHVPSEQLSPVQQERKVRRRCISCHVSYVFFLLFFFVFAPLCYMIRGSYCPIFTLRLLFRPLTTSSSYLCTFFFQNCLYSSVNSYLLYYF